MEKVVYVYQVLQAKDNPYLVQDVSTLIISLIWIVIYVVSTLGFRGFYHDAAQAYLKRKSKLTRRIYIKPKPQDWDILGLREGDIF